MQKIALFLCLSLLSSGLYGISENKEEPIMHEGLTVHDVNPNYGETNMFPLPPEMLSGGAWIEIIYVDDNNFTLRLCDSNGDSMDFSPHECWTWRFPYEPGGYKMWGGNYAWIKVNHPSR